jgi:hypothetical protein
MVRATMPLSSCKTGNRVAVASTASLQAAAQQHPTLVSMHFVILRFAVGKFVWFSERLYAADAVSRPLAGHPRPAALLLALADLQHNK